MRQIDQYHKTISMTPNPLEVIEKAGRTCYKSYDKLGCTLDDATECRSSLPCGANCPHHSSRRFVEKIISLGHTSVLEHASMTVMFKTDRATTHEFVRHRIASYSQESQRYVRYGNKEIEFITPVGIKQENLPKWISMCENSEFYYNYLLSTGESPQIARTALNNSCATEIIVTANFREWRHIFNLRCDKAAAPQIRDLLCKFRANISQYVPIVFD